MAKVFTLLPGEMVRHDPPEGGSVRLEITDHEVDIIQAKVRDHEQDEAKQRFLMLMLERCPFVVPSNTMH